MCAQFNGGVQSSRTSGKRAKPFLGSRGEISRASCRGSAWAGSWRTRHGKRGSHWREYERKWRKCMKENLTVRHWSKRTGTEWSVLSLALTQPLFPSRVKLNFYWSIRVAVGCMAAWSEKGQVHLSWEAGWQKIVCRSPAIPQTVPVSSNTYQSTRKWLGFLALPLESQPAKEPRIVTGDIWTRVHTPLMSNNPQPKHVSIWHLAHNCFLVSFADSSNLSLVFQQHILLGYMFVFYICQICIRM